MSRGTNEFKTMEFTDNGVCKNAMSDNIETKDIGEQLTNAFGVETKGVLGKIAGKVGRFIKGKPPKVNEKDLIYRPFLEDIKRSLKADRTRHFIND